MDNLLDRIKINPEVCHGKPVIRDTRYTVESMIEYLAGGDSIDDILAEFHDLQREDGQDRAEVPPADLRQEASEDAQERLAHVVQEAQHTVCPDRVRRPHTD